jgi:hypothetical protein
MSVLKLYAQHPNRLNLNGELLPLDVSLGTPDKMPQTYGTGLRLPEPF